MEKNTQLIELVKNYISKNINDVQCHSEFVSGDEYNSFSINVDVKDLLKCLKKTNIIETQTASYFSFNDITKAKFSNNQFTLVFIKDGFVTNVCVSLAEIIELNKNFIDGDFRPNTATKRKFDYGKYKGKDVIEICEKDPSYIAWAERETNFKMTDEERKFFREIRYKSRNKNRNTRYTEDYDDMKSFFYGGGEMI